MPFKLIRGLQLRAATLAKIRSFFDLRGFLEVETPLLSHDTVIDRHLDPLRLTWFTDPQQPESGESLFLQTSPEFAMKRLLVGGAPSIYQICKAFRGGAERGPLHNPEFTMVEWYGVGQDYQQGMQLLGDLAAALFGRGAAEILAYRQAFQRWAGVDPFDIAATLARHADLSQQSADDVDLARDYLLTSLVEPELGRGQPMILCDYPATHAALAQIRPSDPPVAERFELYVDGIELANGYHELLDANVLRERNQSANLERELDGKLRLPETSRLLEAMERGLPACTGCALGLDRVLMILAGASSIDDVLPFPIDLA